MALKFRNTWNLKCFDNSLINLLWEETVPNIVVTEGLISNLKTCFCNGTKYTPWYVLLFSSNSTPAAGWTYSAIGSSFTEFTSYDETERPSWDPTTPTTASIVDSVSFTASTGVATTIYGAGLVNFSTKGDNVTEGGVLWCASKFSTSRAFNATEVLQVSYTITAQDV